MASKPTRGPKRRYTHTFAIAFSVRSNKPIEDVAYQELWAGLLRRVAELGENTQEIMEAAMPQALETEDHFDGLVDPDLLNAGHGELVCKECGEPCWVTETGVSHHWGSNIDDIDYEADRDHVAVPERKR